MESIIYIAFSGYFLVLLSQAAFCTVGLMSSVFPCPEVAKVSNVVYSHVNLGELKILPGEQHPLVECGGPPVRLCESVTYRK